MRMHTTYQYLIQAPGEQVQYVVWNNIVLMILQLPRNFDENFWDYLEWMTKMTQSVKQEHWGMMTACP